MAVGGPWIRTSWRGHAAKRPAIRTKLHINAELRSGVGTRPDFGPHFRPCAAEHVIVYNVEDDRTEQRRRLSATLRYFGATPADIRGKVFRVGSKEIGTLFERGADGKIRRTEAMEALVDLLNTQMPATLIVDPLAELHNCEENDNTALRTIIAEFRKLAVAHNMAIIVLHHTRKGSGQAAGDPEAARGASSIIGAVRIAMTLTGMSQDDAEALGLPTSPEARSHFVRLDDAKSNYAPLRTAQWFEKLAYLLDNGEEVAAAVPWAPPTAKKASLGDLLTLATAIAQGTSGGQPGAHSVSC